MLQALNYCKQCDVLLQSSPQLYILFTSLGHCTQCSFQESLTDKKEEKMQQFSSWICVRVIYSIKRKKIYHLEEDRQDYCKGIKEMVLLLKKKKKKIHLASTSHWAMAHTVLVIE